MFQCWEPCIDWNLTGLQSLSMTQQGHLKVVGDKGILRLFNWRTSRGQIKGKAWGPRAYSMQLMVNSCNGHNPCNSHKKQTKATTQCNNYLMTEQAHILENLFSPSQYRILIFWGWNFNTFTFHAFKFVLIFLKSK